MRRRFRFWLCDLFLRLARWAHPNAVRKAQPNERVWQVIALPRRLSETEQKQIQASVENL